MASSDISGSYAYSTVKGVFYGPGCLKDSLPKLVSSLGATNALIVTGKSLQAKTDVVRKVEGILKDLGVYGGTFSDIGEHSPTAGINAGIDAFSRANANFIVSVGGGSPIDASKVMAHRMHERAVEEGVGLGEDIPYVKQIAIPTTLSVAETTASIATPYDKQALARTLSYLRIPSSISIENDVRTLGAEITKLVYNLDLNSSLSAYGVPKDDLPKIAAHALGRVGEDNDKIVDVVKLLEGIY